MKWIYSHDDTHYIQYKMLTYIVFLAYNLNMTKKYMHFNNKSKKIDHSIIHM